MKARRTSYIASVILLSATGLSLLACSGSSDENGPSSTTAVPSTAAGTTTSVAASTTPFVIADLKVFVLQKAEGDGLVEGLSHRPTFSGTAKLTDVRHWTLVQPERLQAAGFVGGYASVFFTDDFASSRGLSGRSLVTAALLFETPEDAVEAMGVFADSRDQTWQDLQVLAPVSEANAIAMEGRLGTDNSVMLFPTIAFVQQVGNVCLIVGSQGGEESDDHLPEDVMRATAEKLLARAQGRLAEIQG